MTADYVAAWKALKESEQFQKWSEPTTIHAPPDMRCYLENRILAAFEHGWNMHLAAAKQPCPSCAQETVVDDRSPCCGRGGGLHHDMCLKQPL